MLLPHPPGKKNIFNHSYPIIRWIIEFPEFFQTEFPVRVLCHRQRAYGSNTNILLAFTIVALVRLCRLSCVQNTQEVVSNSDAQKHQIPHQPQTPVRPRSVCMRMRVNQPICGLSTSGKRFRGGWGGGLLAVMCVCLSRCGVYAGLVALSLLCYEIFQRRTHERFVDSVDDTPCIDGNLIITRIKPGRCFWHYLSAHSRRCSK